MQTAKHNDGYTPDNYIEGPDIYAVMLYDGSYITEDNNLSLSMVDARQFLNRREAIDMLPYWQGQGYEGFVIDISEKLRRKQQEKNRNSRQSTM
jgi:hypothetical protein